MSLERILQSLPNKSPQERDQIRSNAERLRDRGTTLQKQNAIQVLQALDSLTETSGKGAMNAQERIIAAFRDVPITDAERGLVQVLLDNPGSTSQELSAAMGYGGSAWHLHFGKLCREREAHLWPGAWVKERKARFYSGILADVTEPDNRFTMRAEAVEALATLGIRARAS